ncbi:MAG: DUF4112 domain-containing protein [Conchiformibius sp.]|nr:DUF4112 domain-containing protein [Conchiformibius sp.]
MMTTTPHPRSHALYTSRSFQACRLLGRYLDDYYLDGIIGLFPVIGDLFGQMFNAVYLYAALFKLRSWRLTLVLLFNSVKDMLIGMIPLLGTFLDFFYKSNKRNFHLLEGFAAGDADTVRQVNRQAGMAAVGLLLTAAAAYWLVKLAWAASVWLLQTAAGWL